MGAAKRKRFADGEKKDGLLRTPRAEVTGSSPSTRGRVAEEETTMPSLGSGRGFRPGPAHTSRNPTEKKGSKKIESDKGHTAPIRSMTKSERSGQTREELKAADENSEVTMEEWEGGRVSRKDSKANHGQKQSNSDEKVQGLTLKSVASLNKVPVNKRLL